MIHPLLIHHIDTPAGHLLLGSQACRLCLCDWPDSKRYFGNMRRIIHALGTTAVVEGEDDTIVMARTQLEEYFAGHRTSFNVPLNPIGTDFQLKVWQALTTIPYGQTISYRDLAQRIGQPTALRAVANANGANALSIFIPCHRVIGANGTLTGYAGGINAKQILINIELKNLSDFLC